MTRRDNPATVPPRPHRHERDDHIGGHCLDVPPRSATPEADHLRYLVKEGEWVYPEAVENALAEARSTPAEALDVERLARAIEIEDDRLPFLDAGIDSTATPRAVAEQVANRYARLAGYEHDR